MRKISSKFVALVCAIFICPLYTHADSLEYWNPQSYPSLFPGAPFHAFNTSLQPINLSIKEQQLFIKIVRLAYCHYENIDINNQESLVKKLSDCARYLGNASEYVAEAQFIGKEAGEIVNAVKFVSHIQNDGYGFSATLVRIKDTGQAVLIIRGVELAPSAKGGDKERDMAAIRQIKTAGMAFGQISSADNYIKKLLNDGLIKKDEKIVIAGTDLGVHIALSINEAATSLVDKIISFDGIGYQRRYNP